MGEPSAAPCGAGAVFGRAMEPRARRASATGAPPVPPLAATCAAVPAWLYRYVERDGHLRHRTALTVIPRRAPPELRKPYEPP
ncbi:hypothetical protein ABT340_00775 [Streptosporangium sp. NPDC000239]|uniref:hypothetical protein n=1 Tax=Streptosporangium sp. NPDC000239 TaxID=3154248 RepID=UPI00332A2AEC